MPSQAPGSLILDTAAEAILQRAFETSPDPAGVVDLNGVWHYANPAGLRMAWLTDLDQIVGRPIEDFLDPAAAATIRGVIEAAARGQPARVWLRSLLPDRTKTWWDVSGWRVDPPGAAGHHTDTASAGRIALWCREVTSAWLQDAELRGQAKILRRILADAPLQAVLEDVCRLAESLLPGSLCGVQIVDRASRTLRHGAAPNLPDAYCALVDGMKIGPNEGSCAAAAASGRPVVTHDITADPDWAPYHDAAQRFGLAACWSTPLRAGGETVGTLALYFNTPRTPDAAETGRIETCANLAALALEQVQAREARAESEARFQTASELIPGYLFVTDPAGRRLYANAYLQNRSGLTESQLRGDGWVAVVHPEDVQKGFKAWQSALETGEGYELRFRIRMANGIYRWHLGRVLPQRDAEGSITAWVGVAVDIDELIAGREMLQRYRAELEELVQSRTAALTETAAELQAEMARREQAMAALAHSQKIEALGQLTGGVAHDFNNILAAITGCLELIDRRTQEPGLKRLAQSGLQAAGRAASLVRQLLAIARREVPSPVLVHPAVALPGMHDLIRHALTGRIELRIEVPPDIWPIYVDAPQLETSLLNLAVNGRDAMKHGGTLTIEAANLPAGSPRPAHVRDRDAVRLAVRDTGIGMDAGLVAQIFEPFFTTKPRGEGTGLGLAMVRSFIQQAGGDIAVESAPGQGTSITLFLPRARPEHGLPAAPPTHTPGAAANATLLVVDDDAAVRDITVSFLRDAGYHVLEAGGGALALTVMQTAGKVDLVVTDLAMPGMDGLALARALRADNPDLPVVFVTGFADQHELAGETVVQKPFTAATLTAAMIEALGRRSPAPPPAPNQQQQMLARMSAGILRDAYLHWNTLRGAARLPGFGQLTLAGRVWADNAFVVSVDLPADPPRYAWVSVGPTLVRRLTQSPVGDVAHDPQTEAVLGAVATAYRNCAEGGLPVHETGTLPGPRGARFERLLLPVTSERGGVTHLLGIVIFTDD